MESDRGIDQRRPHPTRNGSGHRSRNGHSHLPAFAALDLGTNNCRLLVARPSGSGFTVIDSFSRIIRLGEGINETGRLSEPAIERAINALRVCVSKLRRWRVRYGRYVATEACRKASNCGEFLDRAAYEADVRLEIIDAGEEAALAARGCGPLLTAKRENAVVFDIGGGSTEVIWLATPPGGPITFLDSISIPMGVVTMADRLRGQEITPDLYNSLKHDARMPLGAFDTKHGISQRIRAGRVQMLGASGTVTTVAGIHKRLPRYRRDAVDGTLMDFKEIDAVTEHLFAIGANGRRANPCVGPERADLVLPGCAILDAIRDEWPVGRLRVADRGVREGILLSLMQDGYRG